MAFTLNPNGETCSLERQYPSGKELLNQLYQLLGKKKELNKKCGIQIYKVYKVCSAVVPEGWKFELAMQSTIFHLHDETFWKRAKSIEDFERELLPSLYSSIKSLSEAWIEETIKKHEIKTIQLNLKEIKMKIENERIESNFIKPCEIELNILSFLEQLVKSHRAKLKHLDLKRIIDETKNEPEELFDLWRLDIENYFERRKSYDDFINELEKNKIVVTCGNKITWQYVVGKKRNEIIASLMLVLKEKKWVIFELDKATFYMNIFSRTFTIPLKTSAAFTIKNIDELENSDYYKEFNLILKDL